MPDVAILPLAIIGAIVIGGGGGWLLRTLKLKKKIAKPDVE